MKPFSLDALLADRLGFVPDRDGLVRWQLAQLRETVTHAQSKSPFYKRHFAGVASDSIRSSADLSCLPVTRAAHLSHDSDSFLCGSRDEVARIITLQSSGTTGRPKRIFYTAADLECSIEYFASGLAPFVQPEQGVAVLLPGRTEGGVSALLATALKRLKARPIPVGPIEFGSFKYVESILSTLLEEGVSSIVGSAAHVNVLAHAWKQRGLGHGIIQSVLLCWDTIPTAVVEYVEQSFGCSVFEHWGMVETGLGGAVSCLSRAGMHVRATDLLVEVTDPETGEAVPDGVWGELVVSTLNRRSMPLIRYATGDLGRFLPGPCPCSSIVPRLDRVPGRCSGFFPLGKGSIMSYTELANTLYGTSGVVDFSARVLGANNTPAPTLQVGLSVCQQEDKKDVIDRARASLKALGIGKVNFSIVAHGGPAEPGLAKRCIAAVKGGNYEGSY